MRTVRVLGASLAGAAAELVTVEARFEASDRQRTEIVITGLPDPVIRESRGRLACALDENRLGLGAGRLYLNLVPTGRKKSGEILDLPLVLAAAGAGGHLAPGCFEGTLFLGEVGIDGTLHGVAGGLAAALAAREAGIERIVAAPATAREAACLEELDVRGAGHLGEVLTHLARPGGSLARITPPRESEPASLGGAPLDEVRGQEEAKLALAVAGAGGHGLLFVGAPGAGKSMLARRLPSLLPPPNLRERLAITRVLSSVGRWPGGLARERPFRAPHHSASHVGLIGGGARLAPGEVTLAHCGVLFLDELPEFSRQSLEALRQPLEDGRVLVTRAGRSAELPARFQLVAAMNPCPCGYRGHARLACTCAPSHVLRYRRRISGPLLDRIELRVEVQPTPAERLTQGPTPTSGSTGPTSASCSTGPGDAADGTSGRVLAARVLAALEAQGARGQTTRNASLSPSELDAHAPLERAERTFVTRVAERRPLSARGIQALRRVALTLADMAGRERPGAGELAQALALRAPL